MKKNECQPLSRFLCVYVNAKNVQENRTLEEFIKIQLEQVPELGTGVGYISLPEEGYHFTKVQFQKFKVGTVLNRKPQTDMTIGELLRKQARFE
ncbi:hypothetical protein [cyanobacterium endosymbiont of Epithemia clementina EcSB]|uniref:hypothetical protein n=1 Tax=cyanobacterium endosymbiont of Epithemia clementina EcSB TaxID=3034674 RepID=UPI00248117A7|nr:hypothetical protein [cyanobacterium endosymbiont of Epithemia clementina EcSB]WGT68005.1 hypothetical protein P3F56_02685 [cyanobacterium endosymbiont of Epithemia clementina EcSB]